jgi:hypothetical protein
MSILEEVSELFSVDVRHPPATEEEIQALQNFSPIEVPSDYLEVVREAAEVEIRVKLREPDYSMYIRIWSPSSCIDMNEAHLIQHYMPGSLAIGDDEGGGVIFYLNGKDGFGLYITGFGDLDAEVAVKIAPSLRDLLVHNTGIERVYDYTHHQYGS